MKEYVVLFSHGNSTDIGLMLDSHLDLAYNCKINIFAYDYEGYGQSNGICSDFNMIEDIEAAYNFCRYQLNYEWNRIILYGQSLGSGPSTYLASNENFPVGGLILHSSYMSGLRIMVTNMKKTNKKDFFPNIDLI
jgi:hypothetical protein